MIMWPSQSRTPPPPPCPTIKDNHNNNRRRPSVDTTVTSISELPLTPPPPPPRQHRHKTREETTTTRVPRASSTTTAMLDSAMSSSSSSSSYTTRSGTRSSRDSSTSTNSLQQQQQRRRARQSKSPKSHPPTLPLVDDNSNDVLLLSGLSPTSTATDISHLYPIVTDLDDMETVSCCYFGDNKKSCSSATSTTATTRIPPLVVWDHHHLHPETTEERNFNCDALGYNNNYHLTTTTTTTSSLGPVPSYTSHLSVSLLKPPPPPLPSTATIKPLQLCHTTLNDARDVGMIIRRRPFRSTGKSSSKQLQQPTPSPSLFMSRNNNIGQSLFMTPTSDERGNTAATGVTTVQSLFESTTIASSSCSFDTDDETLSVIQNSSTPRPRRRFDELYVLTRLIFQYDQSSVWECVHRLSGQRYCVKILDNATAAAHYEVSVHYEVSMLQAAQSHDNIIALIEVLYDNDCSDDADLILPLPSLDDDVPQFHSSQSNSVSTVTSTRSPKTGKIYMIMEWMSGGNLLSYVMQQQQEQGSHHTTTSGALRGRSSSSRCRQRQPCQGLDERTVQIIAVQLLRAIRHLHTVAFVHHNNLHPANILLGASWDDAIKVADFGSATPQQYNDHPGSLTTASVDSCDAQDTVVLDRIPSYESSTSRATRTRTSSIDVEMLAPHSLASRARTYPELKGSTVKMAPSPRSRRRKRPPGAASDMRSVGRILQFCLFGVNEFNDTSSSALSGGDSTFSQGGIEVSFVRHRRNKDIPYQYSHVSRYCKQFLNGILHKDPSIRLTLDEALNHPWLTEFVSWEPKLSSIACPISLPISPPSVSSTLPESSTSASGRCQVAADFTTKKGSRHGIVQSGPWSVARIWDFLYRRTTSKGEVDHILPPSNIR